MSWIAAFECLQYFPPKQERKTQVTTVTACFSNGVVCNIYSMEEIVKGASFGQHRSMNNNDTIF